MNHDDIWSLAIQEAYASASTEEVILHTLEIRHPSITDPIRIVADYGDSILVDDEVMYGHYLTLEDDAPSNPGEEVLFQACMFDFSLPDQKINTLPQISVSIDNVTREIMEYVDSIITQQSSLNLTYREYLYSDKSTPQYILSGLTMKKITCDLVRVTGIAEFTDLVNKSFPGLVYRPEEFRGLSK